jgi:hypothetical protein
MDFRVVSGVREVPEVSMFCQFSGELAPGRLQAVQVRHMQQNKYQTTSVDALRLLDSRLRAQFFARTRL